MFEENSSSRSWTGLTLPEDSQEANTALSHVLGAQGNVGHVLAENSDRFPSSSDLPANPALLQHHLANLKTMMSRQRAEYESKIASLEQRSRALQSEIEEMHSKLGQQRKWYSLMQMKIRNAERAKDDAERRNEMLQKEMEDFFDTFGEINKWRNNSRSTYQQLSGSPMIYCSSSLHPNTLLQQPGEEIRLQVLHEKNTDIPAEILLK